ncbi:MAG TPA: ABC transporter substrate-binding protein [Candidatus Saccharimonadales bacterium]|nr:ABC transporter substrate-binding protein [Candidatus Saccharimonadales bacterium]
MENQNTGNQTDNQPSLNDVSSPPPPNQQPQPQRAPTAVPPNVPQVISNNQKPKRRWPKVLMALIILVLLGGGGWYLYGKQKDDQQPSAPLVQSKNIDKLNVGVISPDYGGIYPDMPVANSYSYLTNAQMFEGLVRYEDKNKIVPLLASDWSNPDGKTWVFNIRSGIQFHDGNEMGTDDVKYSIDKIKNNGTDFSATFTGTIESVKILDTNQVEIKTKMPDPTLLNKLAFLYIIDANKPKDSESSQAGTGPYMIKAGTKPSSSEVQMVAFDGYHGSKPATREIYFGAEKDDEAMLKAFNEGKYDIAGPMPINDAKSVTGAAQFISSEPEVAFLGLNSIKPGPLKNKKVREAIRYSIDASLLGQAQGDKVTPISQLIPESIPGYNPAITVYKRDVTKARSLLKQAGYPDGVTIRFSHNSDEKFVGELTKQLKEAKINLELDRHEDFSEFIDYFSTGKAEMYYIVYASDILDGLDIYQTTLTTTDNYKNDNLNKTLDEANRTVDPAKRLKLLQEAAVTVDKDVAVVPVSTRDAIWLMDKDYDIRQDMPSSLLSVYFYKTRLK